MRKMLNWIQLLLQGTVAAEVKIKAETILIGAMHRQEARKEAASPFSPPARQSPSSAPYWQNLTKGHQSKGTPKCDLERPSLCMAPYSSTFAWKIPWMEEPGRLQSTGSLGVGHN